MNEYKLIIYPKAEQDLENIFHYICNKLNNKKAAIDLINLIEENLKKVQQMPNLCPLINNEFVNDKTLRKLIIKNYIVFYKPNKSELSIEVIRVLQGLQDYEKIL